MDDLISRQAAIDEAVAYIEEWNNAKSKYHKKEITRRVQNLPSAQPERKNGKWVEKHHAYSDEEKVIEEWQSCKCSVCGRYDTRPYLYYFDEPHFCSWCGADMRGE